MKKLTKKYLIQTFGCQMNAADSERFASILEKIGYKGTSKLNEADLIIINSCSVRQKAEDRVVGMGNKIKELKLINKNLKVVLSGCMARRSWKDKLEKTSSLQKSPEKRAAELIRQMPWLDFVLETKHFGKLPQLLGFKVFIKDQPESYLSYKPVQSSTIFGYVPISTGCDHFCTYCIVPFARGGEICRNTNEIITEIKDLLNKGYKDITLLGQTVNRYINPKFDQEYKKGAIANTSIPELNTKLMEHINFDEPKDFLQLLQKIDSLQGDFWLSFVSSHPNYMTKELIQFIAKSKHIRPYIHFALQSGSNEILKRMNRRYTVEEFTTKVKLYKKLIPQVSISTDIIVGFPKETDKDFQESCKIMKKLEFDMAFISEYSPRKGTASALLADDIPHKTKTNWKQYLNDKILAKTALKNNQKLIGTMQKCLVVKIKSQYEISARTAGNKEVRIVDLKKNFSKDNLNTFINIKIENCTPWALEGSIA